MNIDKTTIRILSILGNIAFIFSILMENYQLAIVLLLIEIRNYLYYEFNGKEEKK